MNAKQRRALELIGGKSLVDMVEDIGQNMTKRLEEDGVSYKSYGNTLSSLTPNQVGILEDLGVAGQLDMLDEQINELRKELDQAGERARKAMGAKPPDVMLSDVVQSMIQKNDPLARVALKFLLENGSDEMTPAASQSAWQRRMALGYDQALKQRHAEGRHEQSEFGRELAHIKRERAAEAMDYQHNHRLPTDATGQKSLMFGQPGGMLGGLFDPDSLGLLSEKLAASRDGFKGLAPRDVNGNPMVPGPGGVGWRRETAQEREARRSRESRRDEIMSHARKKAMEV